MHTPHSILNIFLIKIQLYYFEIKGRYNKFYLNKKKFKKVLYNKNNIKIFYYY